MSMSEPFNPIEGVYDGEGDGPIDENPNEQSEVDADRARAAKAHDENESPEAAVPTTVYDDDK
jgi:hypothetical protein